jgi:hypothetical protein
MKSVSSVTWLPCAALSALVLSACGGGTSLPPPPGIHSGGTRPVTFTIDAATRKQTNAITNHLRHPMYLSPATQSLQVVVNPQGASSTPPPGTNTSTQINTTIALSPSSTGCQTTLSNTVCSLTVNLSPGNYVATLTAYDGAPQGTPPAPSGNPLSGASQVPFTVSSSQPNNVNLTLFGIPVNIVVAPQNNVQTIAGNLTIAPGATGTFVVEALDADNNVIIGPGAPGFTVQAASSTPSGWSIATPAPTSPNLFSLTAPATAPQSAPATISIGTTFPTGPSNSFNPCSLHGGPEPTCGTNIVVTNDTGSQSFSAPGTGASFTVPNDVTSIQIVAAGGAGGAPSGFSGCSLNGGAGAILSEIVPVSGGTALIVDVGGTGGSASPSGQLAAGGINGGGAGGDAEAGGGGGASDVYIAGAGSINSRLMIVAGGGGGTGSCNGLSFGGAGGAGGTVLRPGSYSYSAANGGNGSGSNGAGGGTGGTFQDPVTPGGAGASCSAGNGGNGNPGEFYGQTSSGSLQIGIGGAGGSSGGGHLVAGGGGGGGSGYVGGGAGGGGGNPSSCAQSGGGGGGGASFAPPAAQVLSVEANNAGNGYVTISW